MILLTGATGYIGSHTWIELLKGQTPVLGLDNLSNSDSLTLEAISKISGRSTSFIKGDVRDPNLLADLFSRYSITHVIHLAGLKDVQESMFNEEEYFDVNIRGLRNLLIAMRSHGCSKIIFSSSAAVYGDDAISPIVETEALSPSNYYGWTKMEGERLLFEEFNSSPAINSISLRYFNVAGQHESGLLKECKPLKSKSLFSEIEEVLIGAASQLPIFGGNWDTPDGTCVRDYLHVTDLAKGHIDALNVLDEGMICIALNLGLGVGKSVYEVVSAYEHVSSKSIPRYVTKKRPGDVGVSFADTRLSSQVIGWSPKKTLSDMCRDSYKSCISLAPENPQGR
jgi:UDP-glucose 4-epimerase